MFDEKLDFIQICATMIITMAVLGLFFHIYNACITQSVESQEKVSTIASTESEIESEKETSVETNINTETKTENNKKISTPLVIGLSILYTIFIVIIGVVTSFYGVIYTLAKGADENQLYEEGIQ